MKPDRAAGVADHRSIKITNSVPGAAAVLRGALVAAALALSACTTTVPRDAPIQAETASDSSPGLSEQERWALHRNAVAAEDSWIARGKVAYRLPGDGGSANLFWRQNGGQSELRLSGPLGAGSTEIRNDGALISVRRDGIERRYPADAAPWLPDGQLLPIPVASLRYWLRGVPDPGAAEAAVDLGDGLAASLTQSAWTVRIEAYDRAQAPPLPSRLRIEAPDAALVLRVLIRDWER
ncbi:MAG: lipoprotein insertase outer membrane protein LolB [Pseudomonadota bacterium]